MAEIATRLGVSAMTVQRALAGRNKGRRREATRRAEAIRRLALELGYRRHTAPRTMVTGRFNTVAILRSTDWQRSHLPVERLRGIEDALDQHGLNLMLFRVSDERLVNAEYIPTVLTQWMVDGLLSDYDINPPSRMIELIRHYRVPAIWMNIRQKYDCVFHDEEGGARKAIELLLELGHRRIALWDLTMPGPLHYGVIDCRRGYERAMHEAGLAPRVIRSDRPLSYVEEKTFITETLRGRGRPTALVTYSSKSATAARDAASVMGLRVPEQLSIITFHSESYIAEPLGLDIMLASDYDMGRAAVELLTRKMAAPARPLLSVMIPIKPPTSRFSMGPPPPGRRRHS